MTERRLFLKSLIGATVGYCFLQSGPLVGEGISQMTTTKSFMELLAEVYTRDAVFAPFERSLSSFM